MRIIVRLFFCAKEEVPVNRKEIISYCLTYKNTYQNTPFRDKSQLVISHKGNRKVFAWFFEEAEGTYVRFRCKKESLSCYEAISGYLRRGFQFEDVYWIEIPIKHCPDISEDILKGIIEESYQISKPGKRRKSIRWYFT